MFKLQTPYQFVCKLLLVALIINCSLDICGVLLNFNSNISSVIRSVGEDLFETEICFSNLETKINAYIGDINNTFNIFSVQGFLKAFSSVGILNLILSYSLRFIMVKIFILIFPFALLSLLNESSSYIFKSYIKSFVSLLLTQSIVALVLLIIFSLDFRGNTLLSQVIFIGALYTLTRVNYFMKELIGGVSTTIYSGASSLKSLFRGG